jgi:hypothetical protein
LARSGIIATGTEAFINCSAEFNELDCHFKPWILATRLVDRVHVRECSPMSLHR